MRLNYLINPIMIEFSNKDKIGSTMATLVKNVILNKLDKKKKTIIKKSRVPLNLLTVGRAHFVVELTGVV
ncbi:hypothetical protein BpHYR1_021195 [Brachionus plicatilis]|uniref:Uncharacterized protein n=1 Tax=Brachionus plicatilis TaxID=10195 RepID=A0A3M7TAJ9_BRAPC|nr:hypothetical protein BpHYR1_021195 [Brachionus plicatilis]